VLTTHYMEEADALCDRLAIIDHGKILVEDTPAVLKSSLGAQKVYELKMRNPKRAEELIAALQQLPGVACAEPFEAGVRVFAEGADGLLMEIVKVANPFGLRDMTITETSLESVFIRLTGRDLRE
jgi:ABC-2 type transport system ATP-binding protein